MVSKITFGETGIKVPVIAEKLLNNNGIKIVETKTTDKEITSEDFYDFILFSIFKYSVINNAGSLKITTDGYLIYINKIGLDNDYRVIIYTKQNHKRRYGYFDNYFSDVPPMINDRFTEFIKDNLNIHNLDSSVCQEIYNKAFLNLFDFYETEMSEKVSFTIKDIYFKPHVSMGLSNNFRKRTGLVLDEEDK